MSTETSLLLACSNNLAAAVEQVASAVVAVNARQRIPSSGVHWHSGVVVTTDRALKREEEITVTLCDNRTVPATVAGRDSSTDLAVLKLPETNFPTAGIGDSKSLKVGHIVLAVGRSGENGISASMGVINAVGGAWRSWYDGQIDQFIRPDLTFYPGFSGGPLVDATGCVVGINTSGLSRRSNITLPITTVNRVVSQLLEKERITRGYLGLGMQPVHLPDNLQQTLNLQTNTGVIIVNVKPDGPGDRAGVMIGDILIALDGTPMRDSAQVLAMLEPERINQTLNAAMIRGGNLVQVAITVGDRSMKF
ncbi:S1C family serine protease [Gloeocapsopsis dulcis]|uniref:S1C family serine protease n=1 Tax=Gloeocapsopsis dulcis TaxID=2859516 RepID=UPI000CF63CFB|nr:trypsin-like peptidase domain-containing protein [Gloeocapsopsis dulcis]WNN88656.1 trypsin-like peptidase domain-containing protein [Gloeocapsopsis dulcis]